MLLPLVAPSLASLAGAPTASAAVTLPGSATYGNCVKKSTSLASTLSPAASASTSLPVCAAPSTAWTEMSMTSSPSRRPFGKPCRSPPSTPSRFGSAVGLIEVFSRSISEGWISPLSAFSTWLFRSAWIGAAEPSSVGAPFAIPVRKISTRSLRGPAGAGTP